MSEINVNLLQVFGIRLRAFGESAASRALRYLKARFPEVAAVQLYQGEGPDRIDRDGIRICPAHRFFAELV